MTLDDRTLELIHGEIDGVIDDDARAELSRLAARDEAVARQLAEMRELQATLASVESLEPPVGLKTSIMARLPERAGAEHWTRRLATLATPGVRFAAATAAVAIVGLVAWSVVGDGLRVDPATAAGTIGAPAEPVEAAIWTTKGIVFDGAAGRVATTRAAEPGLSIVTVSIDAAQPLVVEIDPGAARIAWAEVRSGATDTLEQADGVLRWEVAGDGELLLNLEVEGSTFLTLNGARGGAAVGSVRMPLGMH